MIWRILILALMLLGAPAFGQSSSEASFLPVPLDVRNPSPFARKGWLAEGGVPLPVGTLAFDAARGELPTSKLVVLDEKKAPLPATFRVLSGARGSPPWVLVQVLLDVEARATRHLTLTRGTPPKIPLSVVVVEEAESSVRVTTGRLSVRIPLEGPALFDRVWFDADNNGFTDEDLTVVASQEDGVSLRALETKMTKVEGFFLPWGSEYKKSESDWSVVPGRYGMLGRRTVIVEEKGPLRATVLVRGPHLFRGEGGTPEGVYDTTARLVFFAGQPVIQVEHALENQRPARWNGEHAALPAFDDLEITTAFRFKNAPTLRIGRERLGQVVVGGKVVFRPPSKPAVMTVDTSVPTVIEQRSFGGRLAQQHRPFLHPAFPNPSPAGDGYRIRQGGKVLDTGDRLDGWVDVTGERFGCTVGIGNLHLRHPKAFQVSAKAIRVKLFPKDHTHDWHVDFGERILHSVFYGFHDPNVPTDALRETYEALNIPLHVRPDPAYVARVDTWSGGLGKAVGRTRRPAGYDRDGEWWDLGDYQSQPQVGIRGYGAVVALNAGGRHRHLMTVGKTAILTGDPHDFMLVREAGRWCATAIPWHFQDFRLGTPAGVLPVPSDRPATPTLTRDAIQPFFDATMLGPKRFFLPTSQVPKNFSNARQFHEGPVMFHAYKGVPDQEHRGASPATDWYRLTGSSFAREGVIALGNRAALWNHWCLFTITDPTWKEGETLDLREPLPLDDITAFTKNPLMITRFGLGSRTYGWQAQSLADAYEVTGDPAYAYYFAWMVRKLLLIAREKDGLLDYRPGENPEKPWMIAIVIQGLQSWWEQLRTTSPDDAQTLADLIIGFGDVLRLECDYQPRAGFPYQTRPGETEWNAKQRREWQALAAVGLALAWRHGKASDIPKMLPEFLAHGWEGEAGAAWTPRMGPVNRVLDLAKAEPDQEPPLAVTDLSVTMEGGLPVFRWTAPSDCADGDIGQLKLARLPLLEHAGWQRRKTHRSFWAAENVATLKTEITSATGQKRERRVSLLATFEGFGGPARPLTDLPGRWFAAVVHRDAAGNRSPLSNVVTCTIER